MYKGTTLSRIWYAHQTISRLAVSVAQAEPKRPVIDNFVFRSPTPEVKSLELKVKDDSSDLFSVVGKIAEARLNEGKNEPFLVINVDQIIELLNLWEEVLPFAKIMYAVKCNADESFLRVLAALGTGFDCASQEEIRMVRGVGVPGHRIIFANPCKAAAHVTFSRKSGVLRSSFDSIGELEKMAKYHPNSELVLRISVDSSAATWSLSKKFGANEEFAPILLQKAKEMGLNVIGICFHVGCSCLDPNAYAQPIVEARRLFDIGRKLGFNMRVLDFGGGFPGTDMDFFRKIAKVIRSTLNTQFSGQDVEVVGEPGRWLSTTPFSAAVNVIGAKEVAASLITDKMGDKHKRGIMYYLGDGNYGMFSCKKADNNQLIGRPLFEAEGEVFPSILWGPTCDATDIVEDLKYIPRLEVGDYLYYENTGAYSIACSSQFNGFSTPQSVAIVSERNWPRLAGKIS